jgi:predicted nuclease of predicted toxin-antitoxin system
MKIKLDENLPASLARVLKDLGHDVHTVRDEGLTGNADQEIWRAAQSDSRFLITQDLDFSDLRRFVAGSHSGIVLVRLRAPSRRRLIDRIGEIFRTEHVEDWKGCFVVVTELKIRVTKSPKT